VHRGRNEDAPASGEPVFSGRLPAKTRLAIIGAGSVGATIAFASMVRGLAREIVLIDAVAEKAAAEAMDLMHGSMFVPAVDVYQGSVDDCRDAAVVVITAGAKQKPGQSRLDLAAVNVKILADLLPSVLKVAPAALVLIVSNPVDVLTYIAGKISSLPPARVIGSGTVLDTSRFRSLLARRLNVAVGNIHAYIVGEHGDSEVPLWSSAQIAHIPLDQFAPPSGRPLSAEDRAAIFHHVRDAAAQVIARKGATNWAVGLAVARILEAVLRDENRVLTVSRLLAGEFGLEDVCLSLPCLVSRSGAGATLPVPVSDEELVALRHSAGTLKSAARSLGFWPRPKTWPSRICYGKPDNGRLRCELPRC